MRWVGDGAALWRVRVDLFAERREPKRQLNAVKKQLAGMLTESDGDARTDYGAIGVDQGTGITRRNVIGMIFWVRADDPGAAAVRAIDVARRAGAGEGAGSEFYDVIVIPQSAVEFPNDPNYPTKSD